MRGFDPQATIRVDSEFARNAINRILEGDIDPRSRVDHIPGGVNPLEMPRTGQSVPPITDSEDTFEEWLKQKRHIYEAALSVEWERLMTLILMNS
jgi:hypothetical protein